MPRALSIQRATVPQKDRAEYLEKLRVKRDYYTRASCRFWVYEDSSLHGAFFEFIEAGDPETLSSALAKSPEFVLDPSRIYTEVEMQNG
jgi:hypothetical protein